MGSAKTLTISTANQAINVKNGRQRRILTTPGKYCWRAEYSGDINYTSASGTNATTECFTTVKQASQTVTTTQFDGGAAVPGTAVTDRATSRGRRGSRRRRGRRRFLVRLGAAGAGRGTPVGRRRRW